MLAYIYGILRLGTQPYTERLHCPDDQLPVMHHRHLSVQPYPDAQAPFDVIAVAASFGGLQALTRLLAPLPAEFPVPIVVVQHLSPRFPSALAELLNGRTKLRVRAAEHGA